MTASHHNSDAEARAAGDGQVKTPEQARQAIKTHHLRWVLAISLVLCVLALGGAWLWYVSAQPRTTSTPSPAVAAEERAGVT